MPLSKVKPGIDDNSDATAITIDSSERVMMGTTTEGSAGADELTVGSTSGSNGITIRGGTTGTSSIYMSDATSGAGEYAGYIAYSHNSDSMAIAAAGGQRIRIDADGLKFGSDTAAANALHDYEEGTFTVTVASGISVSSYDHQIGHYVKVGRMVTAWVFMEYNGSSRTSSHFIISGLPFTSSNDTSNEATMGGFITYQNGFSNAHNIIHVARNNTKAFFYELDGSDLIGSELSGASGEVRFVVQYTVA